MVFRSDLENDILKASEKMLADLNTLSILKKNRYGSGEEELFVIRERISKKEDVNVTNDMWL